MAELGGTTDPKALVPGTPSSVLADAQAMTDRAVQLDDAADALAKVRVPDWTGVAADAFWSQMNAQPKSWRITADALTDAAGRLTRYADVLTLAQADAAEAIDLWEQGETATDEAVAAYNRAVTAHNSSLATPSPSPAPAPFVDPGGDLRAQAQQLLDAARRSVQQEGDTVAEALAEIVVSDAAVVHDEASSKGPDASGSTSGPLFTIDPETGEVTLDVASAEGQASLFSAEASTLAKYGSLYAGAEASTMIGAKGEAAFGVEDWTFDAHAEGSVGIHGDASAKAGFEHGEVGVNASGLAGAYAEAGVQIGKEGVHGTLGGFAGAKGEVGADVQVGGIGVEAGVEGWAGAGAEAGVHVGPNPDGSWTVKVNAGAAVGLGGGAELGITVDPQGVVDAAEDAAEWIGGLFPG